MSFAFGIETAPFGPVVGTRLSGNLAIVSSNILIKPEHAAIVTAACASAIALRLPATSTVLPVHARSAFDSGWCTGKRFSATIVAAGATASA